MPFNLVGRGPFAQRYAKAWVSALLASFLCAFPAFAEMTPGSQLKAIDLTLAQYLRLVLERNESVQAQMLETEVTRRKAKGETGIFEPELILSAERDWTQRLNNSLQQSETGGLLFFEEQNNIYDEALEALVPTGGKIRLGFTLSDLSNNLTNQVNIFSIANRNLVQEYQTFIGGTLTQPLLKNFGPSVTMAGIRLAALESDIAFQQYRRQLMLAVSQAEAAYWNLYYAQEQMHFFDESLAVAESILSDSQQRLKVGQASELDVLEAQSGLALRKTKQNEAKQSYFEAVGRMRSLYGSSPAREDATIRAVDSPPATKLDFSYSETFQQAFKLNPEYLIQRKKVDQEALRLGVARNQLLPELNFKGSYGFSGLGISPGDSLDSLETQRYPAWTFGIELHIPLAANIKGRNFFGAAKLSLQEAEINLNSLETQIANALNTAIMKARNWQESIKNYETVVRYNEDLLKTQLARLNVGNVDARRVLEVEADLFDARQNLAEALVHYQRTVLEMQLADGSVLQKRNLDTTRDALQRKTLALLKAQSLPSGVFQPVVNPLPN